MEKKTWDDQETKPPFVWDFSDEQTTGNEVCYKREVPHVTPFGHEMQICSLAFMGR